MHDLIVAGTFIAMIAAPCFTTMLRHHDGEER